MEKIERKFWDKTSIKSDSECWLWKGAMSGGYGRFWFRNKVAKASRVAWILANNKEIPDGLLILHTCDNPRCVNPSHLYAGTQSDNLKDRAERNSHNQGGMPPRLSIEDVENIKFLCSSGKYEQAEIANRFHISRSYVSNIVTDAYPRKIPLEEVDALRLP